MIEKRFTKDYVNGLIYVTDNLLDKGYCIICEGIGGDIDNIVDKLNEQQAIIEEYEDFCYNLCMFLLSKDLDDEYRKKYGKEYKFLRLGGYSK